VRSPHHPSTPGIAPPPLHSPFTVNPGRCNLTQRDKHHCKVPLPPTRPTSQLAYEGPTLGQGIWHRPSFAFA
ncbi:unnamed protein product, partial [Sphenostylis stenocarpa]